MKNRMVVFSLLFVFSIGGCVSTGNPSLKTDDTRPCAQNFTSNGNIITGSIYKTSAYIKNVSKSVAMKRAAQYTISDGWTITNSDKDLGIISAAQTVSYGKGKTAPFNISIESQKDGLKVNLTYSTSGGVFSSKSSIKKHFCSTISAIQGT